MSQVKKVLVIGPTYPYKGGIAHYTSLMARALEKKYKTEIISYKIQYPKFLYPGAEQKDFKNDSFKYEDTKFLINTINPFNWINTAHYIIKKKPDIVIVQWWHPYFAPCYFGLLNLIKKYTKIVFLCHNVLPHERLPMDRFINKQVLKVGSGFIVQSKLDEENLVSLLPDALITRTVHPTYNVFRLDQITEIESRKVLGLTQNEKVLLFFGFIREYKGLKYLIKALHIVKEKIPNVKLLVVGDFYQDKQDYLDLIIEYGVSDYLKIFDGYIPDNEVEKYFLASDLVVLPYESATQSGIVQIAYGFNKPVIATEVGGLPEVVTHEKTGYIVPPKNPQALAEVIIRFFKEDREEEFKKQIIEESYRFSWERLVEIVDEYLE